jgi:hypothetical protein
VLTEDDLENFQQQFRDVERVVLEVLDPDKQFGPHA